MRIERLDLHAYGHYQDATLDLSSSEHGVTVLHGSNEAGKSTARRALVAVLFGIDRDTPDAHRYGPYGLRLGATLRASDGTVRRIVRHGVSGLAGADGEPVDDAELDRFRSGVGKLTFARLFAIDHEELRRGSESLLEAEGEIGRLVFGASLGAGSVSAVLARLDQRAATLYRDRGSAQRIPRALKAYQEGMKEARASRVRAREWERLRQDVELAARRVDEVRAAFTVAQADQLRMSRLKSAKPLIDRRRSLAHKLGELGPVASPEWAARAEGAVAAFRRAREAHDRAGDARTRLTAEVARTPVPTAVLDMEHAIESLVRDTGRYGKDMTDLPTRQAEHEQAIESVQEQLERLGKSTDDGTVVAESDLVELERLARRHTALETNARTAASEVEGAEHRAAQVRAQVAARPEPVDVGSLARALDRARAKLELARALPAQRAESTAVAAQLESSAARLGLGALDRDGIESLVVPASTDLEAERARREQHRFRQERLEEERARLEAESAEIDRQVEQIATHTPDPGRVLATRSHRDAGWRAVRATVEEGAVDEAWAGGRALLDAYEDAVSQADAAADERYARADAIAKVEQLHGQRAEVERKLGELRRQARQTAEDDAAASAAWTLRWSRIGVEAGTPEAMLLWLADQRDLVAAIGRWRREQATLAAAAADLDQLGAELRSALEALGERPSSPRLELLVAQAAAMADAARDDAVERRALDAELAAAEREVPKRAAELESRRVGLEEWHRSWAVAVQALGMNTSTSTEAALVAVAGHRALTAARRTAGALAKRIAGIERDCHAYEARVTKVVATVATGEVAEAGAADATGEVAEAGAADGRTPLGTVAELQRRLRSAQEAAQRRRTLEERLADAARAFGEAADAMDAASRALATLRVEAGMLPSDGEPDAGIDDLVDRAKEAGSLRSQLTDVEEDILDQGGGSEIDQLEADVIAAGDLIDGELTARSADVKTRQSELESANLQLADARKAFAAVSDAAAAADLEQDAVADFARAATFATDYARTALAAEVLRRAIAEHGERHRAPLLGRAADLLALMTDGAFVKLVTASEDEHQILLVQRLGGEHCRVDQLSDGTRDQLYLALRLAGIEHQLRESPEPLPVVLDDVLVHFDDRRAAATIRALGELSLRTQVLLFTHHEQVVKTVERVDTAAAIVRLSPRRHDVPPPVATSTTGEERIVAALRAAGGRSLGKAELMATSGLPEAKWSTTIRSLVRQGSLVQEGERRGARYRLAAD